LTEYAPGLVLLHKPESITSFGVLHTIKKKLHTNKVGHCGTLDKFASGLLLILTGRYTKLNPLFTGLDKQYKAVIRFGIETDTLDPTGEIIKEKPVPTETQIVQAIKKMKGEILQEPPRYSAVHINGERSYKKARKGEIFNPPVRRISIYSLTMISFTPPDLHIEVHCSSGTYIRSIARDLGRTCGSCAHVIELKRTTVGNFHIDNAVTPELFEPLEHLQSPDNFLHNVSDLQRIVINDRYLKGLQNGLPLNEAYFDGPITGNGRYAAFNSANKFIILFTHTDGEYKYQFVNS
jgi:tRNA pseudouridine55 synthase